MKSRKARIVAMLVALTPLTACGDGDGARLVTGPTSIDVIANCQEPKPTHGDVIIRNDVDVDCDKSDNSVDTFVPAPSGE